MATDPARISRSLRIECTLHDDPRLMVGITEIVVHAAQHAGLSEQAQENLRAAVAEACREAFLLARDKVDMSATVKFVAADFPDRVEVTIEPPQGARSAGAGSPGVGAQGAEAVANSPTAARGVGVQRDVREGRICLTLAKSNGGANSGAASKCDRKV
jgi:hypothetical protein